MLSIQSNEKLNGVRILDNCGSSWRNYQTPDDNWAACEIKTHKGYQLEIWDTGDGLKELFGQLFDKADMFIFVVDSKD